MTLEQHFGLSRPPFPKAADKACLLTHTALQDVLRRLHFAVRRDTIALLIADSGCGKSTALSLFAQSLDAAHYHVLTTSLTTLSPFGFLSYLCGAIGLRSRRFKGETAAALLAHLRGLPKKTVLLIDETHQLPDNSLEDLRLLTADHFDRSSPFSLILAGLPPLKDKLAEPQHEALAQRIGVRLRLRPLNDTEVPLFLDRHLKAAGARKNPFEADAITALFQHTRGIPRLLQNLALSSMLLAIEAGKSTIDTAIVQQAVVDWEAL